MTANLETHKEQVIDTRNSEQFNSIDSLTALPNHIPNSKNVPYEELFNKETGRFKERQEMLECM
jgi:3-mercaptopyruvate sulfurtransferase SseA